MKLNFQILFLSLLCISLATKVSAQGSAFDIAKLSRSSYRLQVKIPIYIWVVNQYGYDGHEDRTYLFEDVKGPGDSTLIFVSHDSVIITVQNYFKQPDPYTWISFEVDTTDKLLKNFSYYYRSGLSRIEARSLVLDSIHYGFDSLGYLSARYDLVDCSRDSNLRQVGFQSGGQGYPSAYGRGPGPAPGFVIFNAQQSYARVQLESSSPTAFGTITNGDLLIESAACPRTAFVYGITGRLEYKYEVSAGENLISVSSLPRGLHFLRLGSTIARFLIQ